VEFFYLLTLLLKNENNNCARTTRL